MNTDLLQLFAKMLGGAPGLAAGGAKAGGAAALGGLLPGAAAGGNPMMALGGIIPGMLFNQSKSPATPKTANPAVPMPMEGGGAGAAMPGLLPRGVDPGTLPQFAGGTLPVGPGATPPQNRGWNPFAGGGAMPQQGAPMGGPFAPNQTVVPKGMQQPGPFGLPPKPQPDRLMPEPGAPDAGTQQGFYQMLQQMFGQGSPQPSARQI